MDETSTAQIPKTKQTRWYLLLAIPIKNIDNTAAIHAPLEYVRAIQITKRTVKVHSKGLKPLLAHPNLPERSSQSFFQK